MSNERKRVAFVTGGTGFVGSHLVEELLRRGMTVRALVRADPKWLRGLDVEIIRGDLFSHDALQEGVDGADLIFHVAGLTRARTPLELEQANVGGTRNVLEAAERAGSAERVLVTSSLAASGPSGPADGNGRPVHEHDPMRPVSMYGRSKARMEQTIRERFPNLPVTVIRPPAVYGPRETDIYAAIRTASRVGIFPIVGNPTAETLSLIHVRDLVEGIADASLHPDTLNETYFLSSPRGYSWAEIADAVGAALGRSLVRIPIPQAVVRPAGAAVQWGAGLLGTLPAFNRDKAREARYAWVCSIDKAGEEIDFLPRISLQEGMRGTVAWYREEGWL